MTELVYANRVHEACSGTGTSNLTLTGALSGKVRFTDKIQSGSLVPYVLLDGNGEDWECGFGTLASATELQRTTVKDSSATEDRVNSGEDGTPVKISLSTNQHEVFIAPFDKTVFSRDSAGGISEPSAIRAALFVETLADMTALDGLEDGESVIVQGGAALNDGSGGIFYWDASDAGAESPPDSYEHDVEATGLFKRSRLDVQGLFSGGLVEIDAALADTATTGGGAIKLFFRKKATAATAWARIFADYVSSTVGRLRLGIRYGQSAAEKFFLDMYSTGDNLDRIELLEPVTLPSRTNSNGLRVRGLSWLSGASRVAVAQADATNSGTAADYWEVPLTKGGFLATVVPTITALKAVDPAKFVVDGDKGLVLGASAIGDCVPFYVSWSAASSATADDWNVFRPSVGAAASGNGRWLRINVSPSQNFANSDATPSIANGSWFVTASTAPAAITDFDDAYEGQIFAVQRGTVDQVITHDAAKIDLGGVDLRLTEGAPRAVFQHIGGIHRLIDNPRAFSRACYADDLGIAADGTDVTAKLLAAIARGIRVLLRPGGIYGVSSGFSMVTGSGLMCVGGRAKLRALTGSGKFNTLTVDGTRTDTDRCIISCVSVDDIIIDGIDFETDGATEVVIYPIRTSGGMATEGFRFERLRFKGFALGVLVGINSAGDGKQRFVGIDAAVNCGASQGTSYWSGSAPKQLTVLEIDNDLVSSTASKAVTAQIGRLKNIIHTGTALTDFGGETDGVTVVAHGANTSAGHVINMDSVDTIGEAVDIQGHRCRITIGTIKNAWNDAVKIIHGGSDNSIDVGLIEASGRSAVALWGSNAADATTDAQGNRIHVGRVISPGTYGLGTTASNVCVVLFGNMTLTSKPKKNFIRIDSFDGDGSALDYGVYNGDAGQSLTHETINVVEIGRGTGWATASCSIAPTNAQVRCTARSRTKMALSGGQTIVTATNTKVAWAETVNDTESLANTTNNKITLKWPGLYNVRVRARMDSWENATPDQFIIELRQGASAIDYAKDHIHFGSKDMIATLNSTVYVDENDIGTTAADLYVYFQHDVGSDRTISDNNFMTYFEVVRLG